MRPENPPRKRQSPALARLGRPTGATGLEPATSGVTGRRSNQLSYAPRASRENSALPPDPEPRPPRAQLAPTGEC